MQRKPKKRYLQYFRKHFGIMAIAWVFITYFFLQGIWLFLYSKIEHKSSVNFYEGMESIQYLMKDQKMEDAGLELSKVLQDMSEAGTYTILKDKLPFYEYPGVLFGLRLGWLENLFLLGGQNSQDMQGNTYVVGFGKGWGFILDDETGEVICESVQDRNRVVLTIQKINPEGDARYGNSSMVTFQTEMLQRFSCDPGTFQGLLMELDGIKKEWAEKCKLADPDYDKRKLTWRLDSFYVKGGTFYPAKVSLFSVDKRNNAELRGEQRLPDELLEEREFQPKNVSAYRIYELDPEKEYSYDYIFNMDPNYDFSQVYGDMDIWEPDDAFRQEARNAVDSLQVKSRASDLGAGWKQGNPFLYFANGTMVFVRTAYFHDCTGKVYRACTYQTFSELLQGNWGFLVLLGWIAVLLTLFAALTAHIDYLKHKTIFMTEEYRNILMDSMAHDLKTPLMAVSGYVDNLKEHLNEEKREHYLDQIQKSVDYMNDIVMKNQEVLKYSKSSKKLIRKMVDIRYLFAEAFDRYEGELQSKNMKVSMEGELTARGDQELLQKVAENLVTNAIRYGKAGCNIQVNFHQREILIQNETELTYQGKLKQLWEPFVRGEESRSGSGTGMGLAIVANILDRHGWKYALEYDKETKVFRCVITIPVGILF